MTSTTATVRRITEGLQRMRILDGPAHTSRPCNAAMSTAG